MQILAEIKQKWSNYNKGLIEAEKLSYLFSILKPNFSECLCKIKKSFQFFKNVKKREKLRDLQFCRIPQIASKRGDFSKANEKKIRTLDLASSCDLIDRLIWRY